MITAIETYLVTNGNGQQAVEFYRHALNAEVTSLTLWKDHVPDCPPEREELVLNAQLTVGGIRIMISDDNPDFDYRIGSNMSAAIITDSVETAAEVYNKLKIDAREIHMELAETFWSPAYANVTDKFGMTWQISTEIP